MEKIKLPETIAEFEEIRNSILNLMANPYCDYLMFMSCQERLDRVESKIIELNKKQKNV